MQTRHHADPRVVMTLDAGGTTLKFSAIRANQIIFGPIRIPSEGDDLDRCLANINAGFEQVRESLYESPAAISFAFPGPADYPNGIIGDLPNLTAFRGGVALGTMLEDRFRVPVFINNDGDLFTLGEAIAGFQPWVNDLLKRAGSPKRYRNLFGITLGTGLGGGIARDGELFGGDNSVSGEAHLLRHRLDPFIHAEEGACIRAVRRVYAHRAAVHLHDVPEPKVIADIATGAAPGNQDAAIHAYRQLGRVAGDVLAQALTLIDGLAVIGGGISGAHALFMPALVDEMNSSYEKDGVTLRRRLIPHAFSAEDPAQLEAFVKGGTREITVPGSTRTILYDPLPRTAVGVSRLGTSEAVAVGAYAFALGRLG